jgi:hypothetical protein
VTALVAAAVAGVLVAGPALAADAAKAPKPAKAEKVKKEKKVEPAAAKAAKSAKAEKPAATPKPRPVEKPYAERRAEDGPWARGANWMGFTAGYARAGGKSAGDALGGYGVTYTHMLSNRWSFGAQIRHEVLGHLGNSYEMSVPMTAEFTRHYKWKTAFRPYLGIGGGYYFHKYTRTGSDYTGSPGGGWHLSFGNNLPLDDRHLLGLDARVGFVRGRGENVVNPVFGPEKETMTQWSVKLNWAIVN